MLELKDLLETLRSRAPWRSVASPMLKSLGFEVGRGYDDTFQEILSEGSSQGKFDQLKNGLLEHLVAGEKSVRIYEADADQRQQLIDWAQGKRVGRGGIAAAFLKIADEDLLAASEQQGPQFVATYEASNGFAVIFAAARSYTERVTLARDLLRPGVDVGAYEKIYGVTKTRVQTYDVLWIPYAEDYICIATDAPEKAPADFGSLSQLALQAMVVGELGTKLAAVNLWPAIDGTYHAPSGQCVELGFLTDAESVKLHKSRRGRKCLRNDRYHVGGSSVVGTSLQPYRVAMRWTRRLNDKINTYPEVQLPGTARMIFKLKPELDYAFVRNCLNISDLEFVLSKITSHL